jgi:hypothetical protein
MRALLCAVHSTMASKLLLAWGLMAFCVAVHATGVTSVVRWLPKPSNVTSRYWAVTWLFVRIAGWIILLHMIEISAWAIVYAWRDAMPDLPSALYFSAVTYTTTGYGDLVLPQPWRLAGAIEALTGILMCGWSTGFFFAIVGRTFRIE